ncbi:hypothetical protein B0H19DRAFT_1271561 [Mycena capillaripes]|nr:hypothetical protein B0H19DRAFT_1271561 [Mycena capillaripes]
MHLILTGATGTVGSPILQFCLRSRQVTQITVLARRQFAMPEGFDTTKARVIIHEDYASYSPDMLTQLQGADGCIWAQGTSQTSVSEKEYTNITFGFSVAAAKAFAGLSQTSRFNFVHVSGKGAERNATLYGRTKARTENALLELPLIPSYSTLRIFNVRPRYVDPPEYHPRPGMGRKIVYYGLAPVLHKLASGWVTPTAQPSRVCLDLAVGNGERLEGEDVLADGRTLLPAAIRRLGSQTPSA